MVNKLLVFQSLSFTEAKLFTKIILMYLLGVYLSRFSINSGYLVNRINCLGMISLSANLLHNGLFSES